MRYDTARAARFQRLAAMGLLFIALAGCSKKPDIVGKWEGSLDISSLQAAAGGKGPTALKLVYNLQKGTGDSYNGTMTSPDQSPQAIPLDAATLTDGAVSLKISRLSAGYEGKLSSNGREITGEFTQGPRTFPLTLKRADK